MEPQVSSMDEVSAAEYSKYLTPFQVEKFTFMFTSIFDLKKNGLMEENDIDAIVERLRAHAGWAETDDTFQRVKDTFRVFFGCCCDQVRAELAIAEHEIDTWEKAVSHKQPNVTSISLHAWLNMWGKLCYGSAGINDFPIWVQVLPGIFFDVMDLKVDGVIKLDELRHFYNNFIGIPAEEVDKVAEEGFRAMTANGDYELNAKNYLFVFANFLLGRTIYGPGKYIFGCFDNKEMDEAYKVLYDSD